MLGSKPYLIDLSLLTMKKHAFTDSPTAPSHSVDVFIIGGGPAGSTAGAWLSQQSRKILICEKERFPRFHIGESLLPNGNHILKEIGVWPQIEAAGFVKKYGAEFTLSDHSKSVRNVFADGLIKGLEQTYQVERARFDQILLNHAEASGCTVRQETLVKETKRTDTGWLVYIQNINTQLIETVETRWLIDASGRNSFMGRFLAIPKEVIPYPGRFAVFNHFENVPRKQSKEGGDIIVLRLEDAWFWIIPISETVTSIGVVAQKGARAGPQESKADFFWKKVNESSFLSETLQNARPIDDYRIESDYCFSYQTYGKEQTLLTGDAASFIDPVFSSGVYLALESGLLAAKTIDKTLKKTPNTINPTLYLNYSRTMKQRIRVIRRLIESYYDNNSFEVFMSPHPRFKIPQAINSILAGCSKPPFPVRWRFWLFETICAIHAKHPLTPPIKWNRLFNRKDTPENHSIPSSTSKDALEQK